MPLLSATNVELSYGDMPVLVGCSLSVEAGERIGLVGRNGTGKTSLLRVMAGSQSPDSGMVTLQRGEVAGYLSQDPDLRAGETVLEAAGRAFEELAALHRELEGVFERMADASGDELERLLSEQARLEQRLHARGGYVVEHRIEAILHGLGFTDAQFALDVADLSGGQRGRLALARLLLQEPGVLLLDEPTNHLDLSGRLWLESFLKDEYTGAVVMVSHDRYLLDRVVDRIVEVEQGRLIDYPGSYTAFRKLRAERRLAMHRAYERQQTEFKREEAFIRKYKAGQRAKQAQGRQARLDRAKAESLERPVEMSMLRMELPRAQRTGDIVASARGLSKRYANDDGTEKVLFSDLEVSLGRGERWGVIGPNGAGKTTLVRCLLGELEPDAGSVQLGTKLVIGYYRQTHEGIDPEQTVCRYLQGVVRKECPDTLLSEQAARDLAGAFLFSGDEQEKELGSLSGGERSRAVLAGLLASAKNVLVLDEPTNHLDIPSAERLEEALAMPDPDAKQGGTFDGTLVLISHDRALIDATCDHLIVLDGRGGATVFHGNYTEWSERERQRAAAPARSTAKRPDAGGPRPAPAKSSSGAAKSKYSWMRLEQIEEKIEQLESRRREIDAELEDPAVWTEVERANGLTEERDRIAAELEPLEAEWLRKAEG